MRGLADRESSIGVPRGKELADFAEDIVTRSSALPQSRTEVVHALGPAAMVDAAGVASNFERMVRIADATGVELGAYVEDASRDVRTILGLERPAGRSDLA